MQEGKTALQIAEEKENTASADATELTHTPRKGWLKKLRDWWEKNRQEIRLVRLLSAYFTTDAFNQFKCRQEQQ